MISLKKAFVLALFAFVLAILGIILAQNAIDTAVNNTSYEVGINNTNLAPTIHPLVPGTGDRVDNTTYTASLYPIELHVWAHANNVSQTAGVFVYINDTLICARAGRPLGGAEEAYRGCDVTIPKGSYYRADFFDFHHYVWYEYPILSGNGTISINNDHAKLDNLTWSTAGHTMDTDLDMNDNSITEIFGIYSSGTNLMVGNPLDMDGNKIKTLGEPTLSDDAVTKNYTDYYDLNDKYKEQKYVDIEFNGSLFKFVMSKNISSYYSEIGYRTMNLTSKSWSSFVNLNGLIVGEPTLLILNNTLYIFVRGAENIDSNGLLWVKKYNNDGTWNEWKQIISEVCSCSINTKYMKVDENNVDIFTIGNSGIPYQAWFGRYNVTASSWSGWTRYDS